VGKTTRGRPEASPAVRAKGTSKYREKYTVTNLQRDDPRDGQRRSLKKEVPWPAERTQLRVQEGPKKFLEDRLARKVSSRPLKQKKKRQTKRPQMYKPERGKKKRKYRPPNAQEQPDIKLKKAKNLKKGKEKIRAG